MVGKTRPTAANRCGRPAPQRQQDVVPREHADPRSTSANGGEAQQRVDFRRGFGVSAQATAEFFRGQSSRPNIGVQPDHP